MKKRIFHLSFYIVIFLFIFVLMSIECFAGGTYYVGQDEGGIYFQTDNDGGWYIGMGELKFFKVGQSGKYWIETDGVGTYLKTDLGRKFYLDTKAKEKQELETARFNEEQERKMQIYLQQEAKKNTERERIRAQERQAHEEREFCSIMIVPNG